MLFKSTLLLGLAATAFAADAAQPVEARSVSNDIGANRMVKVKRSQANVAEELAKRAPETHSSRERRSNANRLNKRHHGDATHTKRYETPSLEELNKREVEMLKKRDLSDNEKRELALLPGLQALLLQLYPGLNQVVTGVENTATGAVKGLDDILKRDLSDNEKREIALLPGLQALLLKLYPGLNGAVVSTENLLKDAVGGLDKTLKKREATAAPVNEKRDSNLPLLAGVNWNLLLPLFHNLNGVIVNAEQAVSGAVDGVDDILKKRDSGLPLLQGLNWDLLLPLFHNLNGVVVNAEQAVSGAVDGLDDILKKRDLSDNEKRELALLPGLQALLLQLYPGLNQVITGVENTATGAVDGLDDILKKRAFGQTTPASSSIPGNTINVDIRLQQLLNDLLGNRGLVANLLRGLGLSLKAQAYDAGPTQGFHARATSTSPFPRRQPPPPRLAQSRSGAAQIKPTTSSTPGPLSPAFPELQSRQDDPGRVDRAPLAMSGSNAPFASTSKHLPSIVPGVPYADPPPATPSTSSSMASPRVSHPASPLNTASPSAHNASPEHASASMTLSRSWQRLTPQSTFVNGRGNVQQPGAATHYVAQGGANGSPVLGVPVYQQAQQAPQASMRREPSPTPPRRGSESPLGGADTAAAVFPNQFGVRQRGATKTSSRPPAPRSSLTGQRRSSAMAATASSDGHAVGGVLGHSPRVWHSQSSALPGFSSPSDEKGNAPLYQPESVASSRSNSLQPPSPYTSTPVSGSTSPTSARSPSPSPSAYSGKTSVLDRPRPRLTDPFEHTTSSFSTRHAGGSHPSRPSAPTTFSSHSSSTPSSTSVLDRPRPRTPDAARSLALAPSRSTSPTIYRSSFASSNGGESRSVTPTPPTAPPAKMSVLDRPRPKTPESGALFRFGEGGASAGANAGRPRTPDAGAAFRCGIEGGAGAASGSGVGLGRPGPTAPDRTTVFSFSAPGTEGVLQGAEEQPAKQSVLDRPRPRTPDSQAWLDGAATLRSGKTPFAFGAGPSAAPLNGRIDVAQHHRQTGSGTTTSGFSSSKGGSYDSLGQTTLSASTPASTTGTSFRPSLDSTLSKSTSGPRNAPLLDFNFDFGSAFGSTETMFGLSDLLKLGTSSGVDQHAPPPAAKSRAYPLVSATEGALPAPTREPESDPHARTASSTGSAGTSGLLGLPSASASANGRTTPRKEPPKVDLQLELELEMERGLPPPRPIGAPDEPRPSTGSADDNRGQRHRAAREHGSISSLASGATSGRSASVSGPSAFSADLGSAPGSSPQPKRRRRRSLASLLSMGSFSQSGHGELDKGKGKECEEPQDEPELARKVPLAPPVLPPLDVSPTASPAAPPSPPLHASTSLLFPPFGDLSLDKSLPPTPLGGPSPIANDYVATPTPSGTDEPESPSKRSLGAAVDAANKGVARQLSRLRNRGSPALEPRAHNANFQVISATTTRRPSVQYDRKSSITSLGTADTHASRANSLEYGTSPPGAPFATAVFPAPAVSPPAAAPVPVPAPAAPPLSIPFGRRLVERFSKNSSSKQPSTAPAATPSESWSMPVRDHSDEPAPPPRMGRRRASLSSLLGVGGGSANADGHGAPSSSAGPKKILGMSLPAGRKSEDLLTSGRGHGAERDEREWSTSAFPAAPRAPDFGSRRSFDLLTERAAITRRPSTDDLLTLATAKLSTLAVSSDTVNGSTSAPSAQPSTAASVQISSVSSGASTPFDDCGDQESTVISTATVVNPADGNPVRPAVVAPDASAVQQGAAEPVLFRSDSLQGARTLPAEPAASVPAPPPAQIVEPAQVPMPAPATRAPTLARAPAAPDVEPVWRMARSAVPAGKLETRLTRAWLELEDGMHAYDMLMHDGRSDRAAIVSTTLMPFLRREEDQPGPQAVGQLAQRHREILFCWMDLLTTELSEVQPSHRGTCLEAVATIAESHLLSNAALHGDVAGQVRYRSTLVRILHFAVQKLNDKAVYANTLAFSGRVFALAFFRIEGVALKLLRALPTVKRANMKRILEEAGIKEHELPPADLDIFPAHLRSLCLRNFREYAALLHVMRPDTEGKPSTEGTGDILVQDGDLAIALSGNWLIRWTASDSDLPFAFYRAYHRQLASHLVPFEMRGDVASLDPLPPSTVITAPGFLFLAASLLDKSESLVHRNLRSVTSIGPNSGNFNTNDSANLSFGQKPKVLELAQRRVVQTFVDIVGGPPSVLAPGDGAPDAGARRYVFSGMLQVWIRACVKRTSLWDVRGIYLLLDLIEGLVYTLAYSRSAHGDEDEPPTPDERGLRLFDLPFLFCTVRMILESADNTVTIMRTIALLYSTFDAFTLRVEDRTELCEKLILDERLFLRLLLHYNGGVRGYWIRLLVWRLSRLGAVAQEQNPDRPPDEAIVALFSLLNVRLEAVRTRHDQLEPKDNLTDDNSLFRAKRSTICSTRGVKEAPWTVAELTDPLEEETDVDNDDARELVRAVSPQALGPANGVGTSGSRKNDLKTVAKVVSWLRGGLGKKQGKGPKGLVLPSSVRADAERGDSLRPGDSSDASSLAAADSPEGLTPLPTTVETGIVPTKRSRGPRTPDALVNRVQLSPPGSPQRPRGLPRTTSSRSEKRRSLNPAFFSFEFENGVVTRSDVEPTVASFGASAASVSTTGSGDTTLPTSPIRPRHGDGPVALSPRVSLRFSKRISILPPAALDLLKEAHGSEPVPPIPARFRETVAAGYDKRLHPYAVRGLRDYEDALDEWTDWVANLEDEGGNGGFVDVVPRLAVSWPLSGSDD
ncbi:hypothetical protein JCM3770_006625 [Rhodotorula araucariae]